MRNSVIYILFFLNFFLSGFIQSQNLVKNPNFVEFDNCPQTLGDFESFVTEWTNPTNASPDFYHECHTGTKMGVPTHEPVVGFPATLYPSSGMAYAGILAYDNTHAHQGQQLNSREYIQTTVNLEAGIFYELKFFVSLSAVLSDRYTQIGYHLSTTRPTAHHTSLLNVSDYKTSGKLFKAAGSWEMFSDTFTAPTTGTYYLTIGNFLDDNWYYAYDTTKKRAYYYIDNVSVIGPGCCMHDLTVSNTTIPALSPPYIAAAHNKLTIGPDVSIAPGAKPHFVAGYEIEFTSDFDGSEAFSAYIGPCPASTWLKKAEGIGPTTINPYNIGGSNEKLCIQLVGGATSYTVEVYTFTGALVYVNTQSITGFPVCVWNGRSVNNHPVSEGTYFVEITLKGCGADELIIKQVLVKYTEYMVINDDDELILLEDSLFIEGDFEKIYASLSDMQTVNFENETAEMDYNENAKEKEAFTTQTDGKFNLYPNPSSGILNFQLQNSAEPAIIRIYDSRGKLIFLDKTNDDLMNIDLSCKAKGIYYLKATQGVNVFIEKIILK